MSNPLRDSLEALVETLVASMVALVLDGTLADVAAAGPVGAAAEAAPVRRGRPARTARDTDAIVRRIAGHPGTTGEDARKALGLEKNRWSTCLRIALDAGRVRRVGEGRSTRYWAA
jgi:hypothetical protein